MSGKVVALVSGWLLLVFLYIQFLAQKHMQISYFNDNGMLVAIEDCQHD